MTERDLNQLKVKLEKLLNKNDPPARQGELFTLWAKQVCECVEQRRLITVYSTTALVRKQDGDECKKIKMIFVRRSQYLKFERELL